MDGQSLGTVSASPENASWTWQALPAGIHTLSARATSKDGQSEQSQTVMVNVLALSDTMDIIAGKGQTLAQVGEKYGVPADQMGKANPCLDSFQPLPEGQPVKVPVRKIQPQPPTGGARSGAGSFPLTILWELKLTKPVERSYCYLSSADGVWARIPKSPSFFFQSSDNFYTQVFDTFPQDEVAVKAQCWGWVEGALEALGDGQTRFDASRAPGNLVIAGRGFQLIAQPNYKGPITRAVTATVPPPYALREPTSIAECDIHGDLLCRTLLSATFKEYILLVWEWQPGTSSPTNVVINDISGYRVYKINPSDNSRTFMKDVNSAGIKFAALPLTFSSSCYGVEAYATDAKTGGTLVSALDTYCPGQPSMAQQVTESPSNWITTGGQLMAYDCPLVVPFYSFADLPAVLVGSYVTYYEGGCFRKGSYSGGVKFALDNVPPGAAIHKATLKFSTILMDYGSPFVATNWQPDSCVDAVGWSNQDWTGWDTGNHYSKTKSLLDLYNPLVTISGWSTDIDVTGPVMGWIMSPESNNGFILTPTYVQIAAGGGTNKCLSGVDNFQLVIDYFVP